jgi:hypothetical protein
MNYDTTRTYARTLSQAFADERASWFEGPQKTSLPHKAVSITLAIAVVAIVLAISFQGAPV